MGTLFYGHSRLKISIDDVLLAHLRAVTVSKLRRGEPFVMTWRDDDSIGDGQSSIWMHPSTDLHFHLAGGRPPQISREQLETMSQRASSPTGLDLDHEATLVAPPR